MKTKKLSVNKYWKFFRGIPPKGRIVNSNNPHDSGFAPFDVRYDFSTWETVHLPHTVREERLNCSGGYNYIGECWYCKNFTVKEEWEGKFLFLEFEAGMQRMDAWLDGMPLGVRYGGFLPVGFDLIGISTGEHLLVLRLDNSDMPDVPPGKPQGELDFCYFGGLYRNAWLYISEKLHFSNPVHQNKIASGGLFVRFPFVSKEKAIIRVRSHIVNENDCELNGWISVLFDGKPIAKMDACFPVKGEKENNFEFTVNNPKLWSPYCPELYNLTVQIWIKGILVDEREERIGIREIHFERDGVVINGEKIFLNGVNRHQEYPYVGFALTDSLQYRDLKLLKDMGTMCIRIAHYPPDTTFMQYCDELGILCIIPTPGWQFHPNSVAFDQRSYENTRRIIRWHRNHPSVLMWEPILNETDYPAYFATQQLKCVQEECDDGQCLFGSDPQSACANDFPVHLKKNNNQKIPVFVREYGDSFIEQYGPMSTTYRVRRGENTGFYPGGEKPMQWSANARFEKYKSLYDCKDVAGGCVWAGTDHNRGYELSEAAVGMLDFLRFKKYSYYMFESQQNYERVGGKCFIANRWIKDSISDIVIYSNAEKVRLLMNGIEIGVLLTNGNKDIHPPVIFPNISLKTGCLLAQAFVGEKIVAQDEIYSFEEPTSLLMEPQWCGLKKWIANGSDLLMIHLAVVDKYGRIVSNFKEKITFFVEGDAQIVGAGEEWTCANPITAEAGESGVLLRAGLKSDSIVVRAVAEGIVSSEIILKTEQDEKEYLSCQKYSATDKKPIYKVDSIKQFSIPESIKQSQSKNWDVGSEKKAFASSCERNYLAENANRKNIGAPWMADSISLPQWWLCDLGESYILNGVFVGWQKDGLWYDYDIETSQDGKDYICQIQNKASGQSRQADRFADPVAARYVRVVIRSVSSKEPVGIYHVEIFGDPKK